MIRECVHDELSILLQSKGFRAELAVSGVIDNLHRSTFSICMFLIIAVEFVATFTTT